MRVKFWRAKCTGEREFVGAIDMRGNFMSWIKKAKEIIPVPPRGYRFETNTPDEFNIIGT